MGLLALVAVVAAGWLLRDCGTCSATSSPETDDADHAAAGPAWPVAVMRRWPRASTLATIGLIVAIPGLVDSGFVGWLHFALALRLALHLPLAIAILAAVLAACVATAWIRHAWSVGDRVRYTALAVAVVALAAQLAAWRVIGWGF